MENSAGQTTRLSHTRSWKIHAAVLVAQLAFVYPFIAGLLYVFSKNVFGYAVLGILAAILTALFGWEIYSTISRRRDFHCVLEDGRIRCSSPSSSTGNSFDLPTTDVTKIVHDDGKITLISVDGMEYWLTANFGNPAGRFAQLIAEHNHSVVVENR